MIKPIIVHAGWLENRFFLWGEKAPSSRFDQIVNFQYPFLLDPFELKLALFREDPTSYYGTFIETEKGIIDVPLNNRIFQSPAGEITIYQAESNMSRYSFPIQGIVLTAEQLAYYWPLLNRWVKDSDFVISDDLNYWLKLFEEFQNCIRLGFFSPNKWAMAA